MGIDGEVIWRHYERMRIGLNWLRMGSSGGLL
jgi:hypothetical protein